MIFLQDLHFGGARTRFHFRHVAISATPDYEDTAMTAFRKTLAGPVSAFVDAMFNFPFIFVKNMVQSDGFGGIKAQFRSGQMTWHDAGKMAYSGFGPFYAGYASSMALSHFLNHTFEVMYLEKNDIQTLPTGMRYTFPLVASAMAGWAIVTPTEVLMLKQQVAASQGQTLPLSSLMRTVWRTTGVSGFFHSAVLTTTREGPFGATVFLPPVVQEQLEAARMPRWAAFFLSTAMVSVGSATLSNPIDALTTRYRKMPVKTPLVSWMRQELSQDWRGLLRKGLGTRMVMYFNGAVVLNLVRPLVEGRKE